MPGCVLVTEDRAVRKTQKTHSLMEFVFKILKHAKVHEQAFEQMGLKFRGEGPTWRYKNSDYQYIDFI